MRVLKKIFVIMFSLMISISFSISAFATETHQSGNIELSFKNSEVSHISFSIYKIGELKKGYNTQYVFSDLFKDLDVDLNSLKTAKDYENAINKCSEFIDKEKIEPVSTKQGNSQGNVVFNDLELGLYFIIQDSDVENFKTESLLLSIPHFTGNRLVYDVVAEPKYTTKPHVEVPPEKPKIVLKTGDDTDILSLTIASCISFVFVIFLALLIKNEQKNS